MLLDGLGLGLGVGEAAAAQLRAASLAFLEGQVPPAEKGAIAAAAYHSVPRQLADRDSMPQGAFGAPPFYVPQARRPSPTQRFRFPSAHHTLALNGGDKRESEGENTGRYEDEIETSSN